MSGKLAGKVAVVTGGSAGIGLGIAGHFAEEGARLFITGRHQSELDKAAAAIGGNAAPIQGDTTSRRPRPHLRYHQGAGRAYRRAGGKRRGLRIRQARGDHRRTFRQDVQHERARPVICRAEGAAIARRRLLDDSDRLATVSIKGLCRRLGVRRDKGRDTLFARGWIIDLKGRDIRVNVLSPGY